MAFDESPEQRLNVRYLLLTSGAAAGPTIGTASGAIYASGGEVWVKGGAGTLTRIGAS